VSDLRPSNRLRLLVLFLMALSLALGSFWLLEVLRRNVDSSGPDAVRTDPDYYVDNFNFVRTSKIGQARYSIAGVRLTHFPKEDTYEITLPVMKSLNPEKPSITMVAQRATANSDASKVEMFTDVNADRPLSKFAPHFHLKSEYLEVFPDDDVVQTNLAVDIVQGNAEALGVGMYANDATLHFILFNNVHTIAQPRKR
jgi:lipopolysaccharide export system protein LptC